MYDAVNRAARESGEPHTRYGRHAIRNWIGGVVPNSSDTLSWIARGWGEPIATVSAKAEAHRTWRYEQRTQAATAAKTGEPVAEAAPIATAIPMMGVNQPLPYRPHEDPYPMMRRQFLQGLLSFGAGAMASEHQLAHLSTLDTHRQFLDECESNIRACWRLMQDRDIVVVPSVLATWLPALDSALMRSSPYRRELAGLATEGYMLGGLVTVLQGHLDRAEWFCRQAVERAAVAGDPDLMVAALKHLATKYMDAGYPLLMLHTYERAVPYLDTATPLLRGRTHLGLALAYAQVGNGTDAERHQALARDTFPDRPEHDRAFVYADARRASLNHYGGLIHLMAGRADQACTVFGEVLRDPAGEDIPERTVIEITNCQVEAAIALGDVDLATTRLETAIQGARRLGSSKRLRDTTSLYGQLSSRWSADPRVKRLAPLFALSE